MMSDDFEFPEPVLIEDMYSEHPAMGHYMSFLNLIEEEELVKQVKTTNEKEKKNSKFCKKCKNVFLSQADSQKHKFFCK